MMTQKSNPKKSGFTLVELLVVIAIIAVLASLGLMVGSRMLAKGRATTMVNNMRQMAPLFNIYSIDNQSQMLPCKAPKLQPDDTYADMVWHEVLLSILYEGADPADFKTETWWRANDSFLKNPLFRESASPRGWEPLNPGYGYNIMLPENYMIAEDGGAPGQEELEEISVPMNALVEPSRTPIIAPCDNYYYRYDESQIDGFESGTLADFLTEGKFPVLFLSGHVEIMRPGEYINRNLHQMPKDPSD